MANPYQEYLDGIYVNLRKACGSAKADSMFAEAKAHLDESVEEAVRNGATREAAQQIAMGLFGDSTAVCEWYASVHRLPSIWRAALWPVVGLIAFLFLRRASFSFLPLSFPLAPVMFLDGCLAVLIVLCYRAKRFTSGVMALAVGCLFLGFVTIDCMFAIPVPADRGYSIAWKSSVANELRQGASRIKAAEDELALLEKGYALFASTTRPTELGEFFDGKGYKTPIYYESQHANFHAYISGVESDGIFSSYAQARQFWENQPSRRGETDPFFITEAKEALATQHRIASELPSLSHRSWTKNLPVFAGTAGLDCLFLLGFGLIADLTAGVLRLLVERVRNRKNRLAAN